MQIAEALDQVADLLEFQAANPFRVRAYRNAARVVRDHQAALAPLATAGAASLLSISGIGKDLADKIVTLVTTGRLPMLEQLQAEVPATVLLMARIPGVGPKKAAALFKELNIGSLDALREACQNHQVRGLKGFGAKTEEAILAGIDLASTSQQRLYWAEADGYARAIRDHLQSTPGLEQLEIAGSYRRGRETVADLDVLAVSNQPAAVMDRFAQFAAGEVLGRGDTKMTLRLAAGLQIDLRVVAAESFGAALQYFTGSKDHNVVLRGLAKARGLKINEYGVFRVDDGAEVYLAGRTEAEVYAALDLPCFPPELREARQEFAWAAAGALPQLITLTDLLGDLHMHTDASDGKATLEEMAAAAQARGLQYIAITDHSKRVSMARGLDEQRLRRQWAEIDRFNAGRSGFRVLKGVEVDILEKGGLDLTDDCLREADWVVASVHYGQNQPRDQITARVLEAMRHPSVCAIAHPTGRLINRRKPYDVDLEAVFRAAADFGKCLELNANPARLDLDDVACVAAKAHGIKIVISSDAHSTEGLDVLRYGVQQARRAGLTAADVLNTGSLDNIRAHLVRH